MVNPDRIVTDVPAGGPSAGDRVSGTSEMCDSGNIGVVPVTGLDHEFRVLDPAVQGEEQHVDEYRLAPELDLNLVAPVLSFTDRNPGR